MAIAGSAFPFTALLIAGAPDDRGVYALWQGPELVYLGSALGRSMTIRSRLIDHYAGQDGPCTQRASHYAWEICLRPGEREAELLEEYRAQFERIPRCNRR
jgi:hypothetical protein